MLLKMGVDVAFLNREIRRALKVIDRAYIEQTGYEAVLTSTFDGSHSPSSLHYSNDAVDVRIHGLSTFDKDNIKQKLTARLGNDYDVVLEATHFHIEYDPK